jgi:hypothetical protein
MTRTTVAIAFSILAGCASSGEIRARASVHQDKAAALEAHGDRVGAAKERAAAEKQLKKADERANYERTGRIF